MPEKYRAKVGEFVLIGIVIGALALAVVIVFEALYLRDGQTQKALEDRVYDLEQQLSAPEFKEIPLD